MKIVQINHTESILYFHFQLNFRNFLPSCSFFRIISNMSSKYWFSFLFWHLPSFTNWTMKKLMTEQSVKITEAYYENERSNKSAFLTLRDFFGLPSRPTETAIGKIVKKFQESVCVTNVKSQYMLVQDASPKTLLSWGKMRRKVQTPLFDIQHKTWSCPLPVCIGYSRKICCCTRTKVD